MVFLVVKNNSTPLYVPSESSRTPPKLKNYARYKHVVGVKIYRSSMFIML